MKVAQIKTEKQFGSKNWRQYGIQSYGDTNDFPQAVDEIILASKTGSACLGIYRDFTFGNGFADPKLGSLKLSVNGLSANKVLRKVVHDYTEYHGFALHINYNQEGYISSISPMDFASLRLHIPNEDTDDVTEISYHPDWGHRDRRKTSWKASDIEWFPVFDPNPNTVKAQIEAAGGIENYKGQIYYINGDTDDLSYPLPIFIAEMTDMRTEEALANITGRNACSNFLPAGILVDIKDEEQSEEQIAKKQKELEDFQGDENVGQLWYMQVKNKEQMPEVLKLTGENYDQAFSKTQEIIPENIGQAFKQPPILRAVNVGAGFGADLMINAYNFYNSITSRDRSLIQEVFADLFQYWWQDDEIPEPEIRPLIYNPSGDLVGRIGSDNMDKVIETLKDSALSDIQKRNICKLAYGLTEEEVMKLLPVEPAKDQSHDTEHPEPTKN